MSGIKKGTKVRVSYEARYTCPADDGFHWLSTRCVETDVTTSTRAPLSAIEVIEEPFEEGAIYRSPWGENFIYAPSEGEPSWVYVGPVSLGLVGKRYRCSGNGMTKLAPVE